MHAVRERIGSIKNLGGLDHQTSRVLPVRIQTHACLDLFSVKPFLNFLFGIVHVNFPGIREETVQFSSIPKQ